MATTIPTTESLIDALIGREGGYTNNPADKGGPTRWGITEQVARAFGYKGEMRSLPRETAVSIYRERYWVAPRLGEVQNRYPAVAVLLLDIGVNMGVAIAGQFLQRSLNSMNQQGAHYADIGVDGAIGNLSLHSLDCFRQRRGVQGGEVLWEAINSLRGARYIEITESRPANEAFTYGWFARMVEMTKAMFK